MRTHRDPCNDGRLPLDQLEDLGLGLLRALLLVLLPGQLSQRHLELVVRDVAAGFLPGSQGRKRSFDACTRTCEDRNAAACSCACRRFFSFPAASRSPGLRGSVKCTQSRVRRLRRGRWKMVSCWGKQ